MSKNRTRVETNYRDTKSKDGSLSITIRNEVAEKVRLYAKIKNINKTKMCEEIIENSIDENLKNISFQELRELADQSQEKKVKEIAIYYIGLKFMEEE